MHRRIYLLRHGDVSYFSNDGKPVSFDNASLNEHGLAQAAVLGEVLSAVPFQKFIFKVC